MVRKIAYVIPLSVVALKVAALPLNPPGARIGLVIPKSQANNAAYRRDFGSSWDNHHLVSRTLSEQGPTTAAKDADSLPSSKHHGPEKTGTSLNVKVEGSGSGKESDDDDESISITTIPPSPKRGSRNQSPVPEDDESSSSDAKTSTPKTADYGLLKPPPAAFH